MIVDTRQPDIMITPFTRAGWSLQSLKFGDYQFTEAGGRSVLIEDKPVGKLLSDMTSGILQRQIKGLVEASPFPILLVRGQWSKDRNGHLLGSNFTWENIWNQLQSLQDIGCRIQLATGIDHAVQRIFELQQYYAKGFHPSVGRHGSGDHRIAVLAMVDGIEEAKAKVILEKYPTLADIATLDNLALEKIPGVGPVLARRIWDFWRKI